MAKKLTPQDKKDVKSNSDKASDFLTKAIYFRNRKQVELHFKDMSVAFLFKLLVPGSTRTTLMSGGKVVRFEFNKDSDTKQIAFLMSLVTTVK